MQKHARYPVSLTNSGSHIYRLWSDGTVDVNDSNDIWKVIDPDNGIVELWPGWIPIK